MPELPEVETVRRQLQELVLKKNISRLVIHEQRILRNTASELQNSLIGRHFTDIKRIGKLLQFHLDSGMILLAHLKMTGQFLFAEAGKVKAGIYPLLYSSVPGGIKAAGTFKEHQAKDDQHTHVVMTFKDGSTLSYRDVRKFGFLKVVGATELESVEEGYGIDPLREDYTREAFHSAFERKQKSLKAVLMDQSLIAGIGNIYADEICHQTKLMPDSSAARLTPKDLDALYHASSDILRRAVQHKGTTFRDFMSPDGQKGNFAFELKAYGRSGKKCLQCKTGLIQKKVHGGRGTHFCDTCQM